MLFTATLPFGSVPSDVCQPYLKVSDDFKQRNVGTVPDIRIPTSVVGPSTTQPVNQPEEDGQMRVPTQQPKDHLAAGLDDLAGQQHEGIQERPELQRQHP